jgi:hypothetical protein
LPIVRVIVGVCFGAFPPIRRVVTHRLQSADSGRSPNRDRTFGLAVIRRGELIVLIENDVVVHTDHGMIWLGGRSDEVRK